MLTETRLTGDVTPAADAGAFLPPGLAHQTTEDPRFPTPSLYDMVLQLNSEPGLEQWWATVTNLMHDNFKADRVTLIAPMDASDIENLPWGQKATFSMNGPEELVPGRSVVDPTSGDLIAHQVASGQDIARRVLRELDFKPQKLHAERIRPRPAARHSYAGHGRDTNDLRPSKPRGPQRTATHAAGMTAGSASTSTPGRRLDSIGTSGQASTIDLDFSNAGDSGESGPYAEVFPSLRPLDHETRPLIEPDGVNRVLDKGRVLTVTRNYDIHERSDAPDILENSGTAEPTPTATPRPKMAEEPGDYRGTFASDDAPSMFRDYAEYEQLPPSPWSQSPAPSPAIQADEEVNPFFATPEQHVEEAFNPDVTPKDYSRLGQVEAIGVECASTVIHVPMVHPILSQRMAPTRAQSYSHEPDEQLPRRDTIDVDRKVPIAILSVLSSSVPYPNNLTEALKLLAPHLATSYATSQQFASIQPQAVTIRHRRTASGRPVMIAPMTIEPVSFRRGSTTERGDKTLFLSGSTTSPSDYSGRSKNSPSSSIAGTPGWDPATHGWLASNSAAGTPAQLGTETIDNYFDAKRRSVQRAVVSGNATEASAGKSAKKISSSDSKQSGRRVLPAAGVEPKATQGDVQLDSTGSTKAESSPKFRSLAAENSPALSGDSASPKRPGLRQSQSHIADWDTHRRHSQLHSYGADFHASFGGLPAGEDVDGIQASSSQHVNRIPGSSEMAPPSGSLLRTITNSVPVQIFTAEPDTGMLSWVNSKFLMYRGQDANQVLDDPWDSLHPEDRKEFIKNWHRSLRTAQQLQQKVRLQRFDGTFRWFYARAAPLKDKRQKIVHWFGTMMDFHEQHIAETNLARQHETAASEAKYRALANSSPQIVFAVSKSKGVTFCNTQWLQFSGQSEAESLGAGFMDHVHPDDLLKCKLPTFEEGSDRPKNVPTSVPPDFSRRTTTSAGSSSGSSETERGVASPTPASATTHLPQRKLSELATTGILKISTDADGRRSYSTEVRLKPKDGDYRWHLVRVLLAENSTKSDGEGEEETWYGTCTDINDHKTLERDLKETMDEKSRFLSNMSHEIRTPLNGITGMVNFLIDSRLTPEQMEHVNIIRASTEGLRGLINDILDLSKAEAGMIQLNMEWLYVRALIEEVNDLTSAMAIDKGLELNYVVEEDVPAQIKGDRFRIRQILLNVIGNAIKFTSTGEVFVRCSPDHSSRDDLAENEMSIQFEVVDTGRGFTDKEAEQLFKRFSQIDGSSTRQHGGTGLGLVISQQLSQLHGGDMSAKGVPGEGATFKFSIKTILPSRTDQPPTPLPTPGGSNIPILPISSEHAAIPRFAREHSESPAPYALSPAVSRESPSVSTSSAGSIDSISSTARTSNDHSVRSSASSTVPELIAAEPTMALHLPEVSRLTQPGTGDSFSSVLNSDSTVVLPPMYSILVLCPLKYSREATVQHIEKTLPGNVPHQITAREHLLECQEMLGGNEPVIFTHIVVVLQDVSEIAALLDQVLSSEAHHSTSIVVITDLAQRKKIVDHSPKYDYNALAKERRLLFVFKPLKPSRFAIIFDPRKEREMSTDRNQDSAQQVAVTQKQSWEELTKRLGNKDKRVLIVEDNKTNQLVSPPPHLPCILANYSFQVITKYLARASIAAEIAADGVECTDKVFAKPPGYYSIILCDLHMPNKDGYQTCKEIRKWERQHKFRHGPIVALSANVLGDVHQKCVDSVSLQTSFRPRGLCVLYWMGANFVRANQGFNSYLTKPVDFKELASVMMTFMDPRDPSKPHELMKFGRTQSAAAAKR